MMRKVLIFMAALFIGLPLVSGAMAVLMLGPGLIQAGLMSQGWVGFVMMVAGVLVIWGMWKAFVGITGFIKEARD